MALGETHNTRGYSDAASMRAFDRAERIMAGQTTETQATHTPGPWRWRGVSGEDGRMAAMLLEAEAPDQPFNDPCVLAAREDWLGYLGRTQRGMANARLIASAPELLAALEQAVSNCSIDNHGGVDGTMYDVLCPFCLQASAAIKKARGE